MIAKLDLTAMTVGSYYKICVDRDGFQGTQYVGDSGLTAYISGITKIPDGNERVLKSPQHLMFLTCPSCVANVTAIYLSYNPCATTIADLSVIYTRVLATRIVRTFPVDTAYAAVNGINT